MGSLSDYYRQQLAGPGLTGELDAINQDLLQRKLLEQQKQQLALENQRATDTAAMAAYKNKLSVVEPGTPGATQIGSKSYAEVLPGDVEYTDKANDLGFMPSTEEGKGLDLFGTGKLYTQIDPGKSGEDDLTWKEKEDYKYDLSLKKEDVLAGRKTKRETQKQIAKTELGFDRTMELMGRLWDRHKEQIAEGENLGLTGGGVRGRIRTLVSGIDPEYVKGLEATRAFGGQVTESALAMNGIVTNQNRVIKAVFTLLRKTLPSEKGTDSSASAAKKIEQSVFNAFGLRQAARKAGVTRESIAAQSDAQLDDPNSAINQLFGSLTIEKKLTEVNEEEAFAILDRVLGTEDAKKYKVGRWRNYKQGKVSKGVDAIKAAKDKIFGKEEENKTGGPWKKTGNFKMRLKK